MAKNNTVNQINFEYNGKKYTLEYTRETIIQMEARGFSINDLTDKPATRIEQLWQGAFLAHHKQLISNNVIREMYGHMKDKEKLLAKLTEMYNNTLSYLMPDEEDDEGNVDWTASI